MFTSIHRIKLRVLLGVVLLSLLLNFSTASANPGDDFVITVRTSEPGSSDIDQFTIPTYSGETYKYSVDCNNDGHDEATAVTGDYTCDYLFKGTYTIRIKDDTGAGTGFPRIYFNNGGDKEKLFSILQWGTGNWTSMNSAFCGCKNLAGTPADNPDLSNVLDMYQMFADAESFNAPIGGWDTSNVQDMSFLFYRASAFNQPIGDWDTSNVVDMGGMFHGATVFNQPIGGWDTRNVHSMYSMFYKARAFNQPIGGWNTRNVKYMLYMFAHTNAFNQPIGDWDTSNVEDMHAMFYQAVSFNQLISGWDTSYVYDMGYMFSQALAFNQDIGSWDISSLLSGDAMFDGAGLSTENYDSLLIGWDNQSLKYGVNFNGGNSSYCQGESARAHMIVTDGWTITDGGYNCDDYTIYLPLAVYGAE